MFDAHQKNGIRPSNWLGSNEHASIAGSSDNATLQQDEATYEYTLNGKQKAVIDANGNRAEMTFDGHDRQRRWIFPSKTNAGAANPADYEEYGYDLVGNRTSLRKRSGAVIGFQYDALNRMIFKDVAEAGGDVVFAYDVRGLQLSAIYSATGLGIVSAYDGFGRQVLSTTSLDGTRTYTFQYDSAGNRTHVVHPDGPWFQYAYDALGRMTTLKEWTGTTLVTLGYNASGARSTATYANGAATSYAYDPIGRLSGLTLDFAGTAQDVAYAYDYNPASQIVSRTIGNDVYAFTKSAASTAYGVNGLNQYTQVAGGAVVHDPNGNLTQEGGRTLGYDSENRLVSIAAAAGSPFNPLYDPQGRLRGFTMGATAVGIDMVGTDIVTLRFGSAPPVERYAFAPGVDEPMIGYDNVGTRYYFHADGHGNVVARSNAAGSAIQTIGYDEYGRPSSYSSRFLHAGKMHFGTVNAYYNNARFYDYNLGRFLQTDPIGYDDQINLYAYVGNDPVNATDPGGEAAPGCGSRLGDSASCSGETIIGFIEAANAKSPPQAKSGTPQHRSHVGMNGMPQDGPPPEMMVDGDTMGTMQDARDMRDVMAQRMTQQQLMERREARATGAAIGSLVMPEISAVRPVAGAIQTTARVISRNVAVEGAGRGARYGVGRVGQIRFGGGRLILRLDRGRGVQGMHINIESQTMGFNVHIPLNPLSWFGF